MVIARISAEGNSDGSPPSRCTQESPERTNGATSYHTRFAVVAEERFNYYACCGGNQSLRAELSVKKYGKFAKVRIIIF